MTETDVEINVDLDTSPAKSKIKSLGKRSSRMTRRIAMSTMKAVQGDGKLGFTVGAIGGYSMVNRARSMHGPADPWEMAMLPIAASVQQYIDETIGYNATARKRAVSQTAQTMAVNSHFLGDTTAAEGLYDALEPIAQLEESGRSIIRQEMAGPSLTEIIAMATGGYVHLLFESFGYIVDGITGKNK